MMKEIPRKKQWKYNSIVRDLHTNKYRQRVKKPSSKHDTTKESISKGLADYFNKGSKDE